MRLTIQGQQPVGLSAQFFPLAGVYKLRKQTVEPVFGIIKELMGFRRFRLRGWEKVSLEWTLVCVSSNLKRLFRLKTLVVAR